MELITDKKRKHLDLQFFLLLIIVLTAIALHYLAFSFLPLLVAFKFISERGKIKQIYLLDDSIKIENKNSFIEVPFYKISHVAMDTQRKSTYKIVFLDSDILDGHVLFYPQPGEGFFSGYPGLDKLTKLIEEYHSGVNHHVRRMRYQRKYKLNIPNNGD
jgi:hypothetical protein